MQRAQKFTPPLLGSWNQGVNRSISHPKQCLGFSAILKVYSKQRFIVDPPNFYKRDGFINMPQNFQVTKTYIKIRVSLTVILAEKKNMAGGAIRPCFHTPKFGGNELQETIPQMWSNTLMVWMVSLKLSKFPGVITLPTQTRHYIGNPSSLLYICIVWSLQNR